MTEILTESFCERCGTRYTFEPVDGRRSPLKRFGTLGRGIRHFVTDSGSSLDEAFAVARSEQEQKSTTHALEAFHRTFNFCLNCRQYTCGDCWNAVEGRCLTCAPTAEALEPPITRLDTTVPLASISVAPVDVPTAPPPMYGDVEAFDRGSLLEDMPAAEADAGDGPWIGSEAELDAKLGRRAPEVAEVPVEVPVEAEAMGAEPEAAAESPVEAIVEAPLEAVADLAEPEAEPVEVEAVAEIEVEPLPVEAEAIAEAAAAEAIAAEAEAEAEAVAVHAEAEPEAAAETAAAEAVPPELLAFEPGQNLDDQLAAYERQVAEVESAAEPVADLALEPEPIAAVAEPELVAELELEPEPIAAAAEPEAEPVGAAEPEPEAEAEPEPIAAVAEPELVAEPEPLAAVAEPEPIAAVAEPEPELVAAVAEPVAPAPEPIAAAPDEPMPIAASAAPMTPATSEPIPTAIGQPRPASVVDGPLAWPDPGQHVPAFETTWPDLPPPSAPGAPTAPVVQAQAPVVEVRRIGANLPSVTAPPQQLVARPCPSCGLSLSASARFCRRCGTPQQVAP